MAAVLGCLKPIWQAKSEPASRVRGRIEQVIDAAQAKGHIAHGLANPARWKGRLEHLLAKRSKSQRGHHAATPYADVPTLMARLRQRRSFDAMCLEFVILTAARSGEALGMSWDEIGAEHRIWTIPGFADEVGPRASHAVEPARGGDTWRDGIASQAGHR